MVMIQTKIDPNGNRYKENENMMTTLIESLTDTIHTIHHHADRHKSKHHNKLLPRDRMSHLIDKDSFFLELSPLAGYQLYDNLDVPAGGIITGIGQVNSTMCMIIANDYTVKGGTYFPITIKKHLRALEIAIENQLPTICLVDSGGVFLPMQDEVFPDKDHFGRIFYLQAEMSAKNIPHIAVVMGSCTAGGAYVPAMSCQVIMVKEQAAIYLGGPPLVKAATGESISSEDLGGANIHCKQSGVADYIAENDIDALMIARDLVHYLNRPSTASRLNNAAFANPYPSTELNGIVSADPKKPFDIKEIIARIVDNAVFDEFKALFAPSIICGFAHLYGMPIGILGNNGILFSESALKATQFIQLCTKRNIPLIFLQNITGFMVGSQYEASGIAKHGAKMVMAVSNANVPKLTVIIGGSFGAGNYAMCGRAFSPRFLFSWPNARISVMGGQQAASVLSQIQEEKYKKSGQPIDLDEINTFKSELIQQYDKQGSPYYGSARLWDDGVIQPKDTRVVLGIALHATIHAPVEPTNYGVFRL
jgi:3-methylcrotonyl-CoA carboxylase beta subunit